MNEPRFIELLNLYVDQQLNPAEAAELEAEIQKSPARHRTYQQYCRMQKACAQLFEHERTSAPASMALSRAIAEADRKIVAFPDTQKARSLWPVGLSMAGVAAAACVAFVVFVRTGPAPMPTGEAELAVAPNVQGSGSSRETSVPARPVAVAERDDFKPVFTMQPLRAGEDKPAGLFISASAAAQDSRLLDWTRDVQLEPLRKVSVEQFAVRDRSATDKPMSAGFADKVEEPANEEAAFTFTK